MKSNEYRKIQVNITTYKEDNKNAIKNMNEDKNRKHSANLNKFICSICLNSKIEDKSNEKNKVYPKTCPICQRHCDICIEKTTTKPDKAQNEKKAKKPEDHRDTKKTDTKSVQTLLTDNKSLNLLNEVLTVFQSKKIDHVKPKTVMLKDASVSTDNIKTLNAKLSVSKVFNFSIDQNKETENGKFIVMSSKVDSKRSHIDLIKNKSSSIPQMKIEELKHSLKEKTKSKDAIEEVNRMFANVKKNYNNNDRNRPSIRHGPRILPVVETIVDHNEKLLQENEIKLDKKHNYKCCQANCMSSGDSIKCCHNKESESHDKSQCCHQKEIERCDKSQYCHGKDSGRCDKCVYMLCCHYKNCRKMQGVMICDRCREVKESLKLSERSFEDSG